MDLDLSKFLNPLKAINPQKIILFGSYASGNATLDSDIDLLVVADTEKNFHQRIVQMRPLLPKNRPIDLIVLTPKEYRDSKLVNPLIAEIESTGRVIYG